MGDVLVVQNSKSGGPGRLGDWLAAAGLELDVVLAHDGAPLPDRLAHRGLIMLGGGYLPSEDDRAPWLRDVRRLAGQALADGVPYFGICLGGQLLAEVAGGEVTGDVGAPENGSLPVTIRPEAARDLLFRGLPRVVPAVEHHKDAITRLPAGAVHLAETEKCPYQAFRVGERAWGVQFHPEVGPERIRGWRADGFDPDEVYARAVADEPVSTPIWREVATRFAKVVAGRPPGSAQGF
ncbi:type 1 glutamine amidotransferase [Nonomuraea jiangxiensis]|uniref:GMP synthase-Glutamine amidotransferase n=1 Tax=Nonomuraea jiangxiensis TaxID=633440 RepID=A0A1G9R9A7_9ACTN|nr:type 1 glutamine amidotransferase [Nonomuraea jiangxiensis]SDM19804.1 GMP synthase-Glutamine amidotransferase [Nonomuraea jiangxiensis]